MRYRDLTGIDYDCEDCIHNDKETIKNGTNCHAMPAVLRTVVMNRS